MDLGKPILDYVDALVHASARGDALTAARHRAFIAPRLFASLIALALFPIYLALYGVPGALEVLIVGWLATPLLVACFLSRTGDYDRAHRLSALALTGFGATIAVAAGGIASFAAIWLVLVPLEAALSASPRAVAFASASAFGAAGLLMFLEFQDLLPPPQSTGHVLATIGLLSAALYATGLSLGALSLARSNMRLLRAQDDRYRLLAHRMSDAITRHDRDGAILFASPAAEPLFGVPAGDLLGSGLLARVHLADRAAYLTTIADAAEFGHQRSVEFRCSREAHVASVGQVVWVEMRCEPHDRAPVSSPRRREVIAVMRDITLQKEQARTIESLRADIEQANAASSLLLSLVSREQIQKSRQLSGKHDNRVKSSA